MKKFIYAAVLALGVLALMARPAVAQEEKPFTIHGEVRFRGEYTANTSDLDDSTNDNGSFWPYRVRIAAEGHFAHNVSTWIEFQNTSVAGNVTPASNLALLGAPVPGPTTSNSVQFYQGNLTLDQLWSKNFSLRIGRQEIVAGNELLLGDLDFYGGLAHDGFVGTWKIKKVNVMVWATRPTEANFFNTDGLISPSAVSGANPNFNTDFFGGYATWTWKKDNIFDVYLMDLTNHQLTGQSVQTVGVRWARDVVGKQGFFWDVEVAQQGGKFQDVTSNNPGPKQDAEGRAVEGWFGYNWKTGKNMNRVYGRYEEATGDKTSTTKYEGFVPMFGDFHNRTGHGDWFLLQDVTTALNGGVAGGLKAVSVAYSGIWKEKNEFGVAWWDYKLQEDNGAASGDKLGTAYDIWYGLNYSRNVNFTASLSQLKPDDALTGGGAAASDTVTRLYGQVRLRF